MPTLAVKASVSLATAVVAMTALEAVRLRQPTTARPAPVVEEPARPAAVPLLGPRSAVAEPIRPVPGPRTTFAMARIHGRVIARAGDLSTLAVVVADATRIYQAKVEEDRFEINLPPGTYALDATAGDETAYVDVPDLVGAEDRLLVVRLTPAVSLSGRVEGCAPPCQSLGVEARVPGFFGKSAATETDPQGEFELTGLHPGRAYDLVFAGPQTRSLTLHAVTAPRQGLVVRLEQAASLSGGFGVGADGECPMDWASVVLDDDGQVEQVPFDDDCRFTFAELPDAETVHVSATGTGWHFEVDVAVPAHGDPPFLCLRAPCRDPAPKASLVIVAGGAARHPVHVSLIYPSGRHTGTRCVPSNGQCIVDDLRSSSGVMISATAHGCEPHKITMDLRPGSNYLSFPCESTRLIRGVVLGSAQTGVSVRCGGGGQMRANVGRLFYLSCLATSSAIEYQVGSDGPWQRAAIFDEEGDEEHDGFVQIAPG